MKTPPKPRQSKLDALSPAQKKTLLRWLVDDNCTYGAIQVRVEKEFGVAISRAALCRYWKKNCLPAPASATDVLLDVILQASRPVRLIVRNRATGIFIKQLPRG